MTVCKCGAKLEKDDKDLCGFCSRFAKVFEECKSKYCKKFVKDDNEFCESCIKVKLDLKSA